MDGNRVATGKIAELDGLRGVLAVWVVVAHLLPSAGIEAKSFGWFAPLFGAHLRVEIFFILSAFVICMMLGRRRQAYGAFLAGRLRRLYPAYVVAFLLSVICADLALTATLEAPFAGARHASRIAIMEGSLAEPMLHILAHLTLLHGVIPQSVLPNGAYAFLGQAWNVSTEFQFYLLAPLLFLGLATGPLWRRMGVAGLCVLCAWVFRGWPNPADLAQHAPMFGLGIASYLVWQRTWPGLEARLVTPAALAVFAGVSMAAGIWIFVFGWLLVRRDQGRGGRVLGWLGLPVLQWLGGISYSLYLLHMIPLYLGMYLINGLGLDRISYLALLSLFTFALALPLARASALWIEAPFAKGGLARPRVLAPDPAAERTAG